MRKKLQIMAMVFAFALSMAACGSGEKKEEKAAATESMASTASEAKENAEEKVFTIEELAAFNGKDGARAYVAVNGIVYDVTGVEAWSEGKHNGVEAGKDLTEAIQKAPHGTAKLEGLPVVGKLAE
ncbi:MAG: cytochrome b5 domain-containing protein [Johnsonella sp.]|nr:cytochrome b5 domain-containing protein [Johnsonella sp.]